MTDNSFPFFDAIPLPVGQRLALAVEYNGSKFHGWQLQKHCVEQTVQGRVEKALSTVANAPVRVHCAGRTDAGVHASEQIIHFDAPTSRSIKAWVMGGNAQLDHAIAFKWAIPVAQEFHARFSASHRRYRYVIYNAAIRSAIMAGKVSWEKLPLDVSLMDTEAQCLLGEQDFSAFRAASCQSRTSMRCVHKVSVSRLADLVVVDIQANAFLHHMVRNIAGALLDVGSGRRRQGWIEQVLRSGDRSRGSVTASPFGLYLVSVGYPEEYNLPLSSPGPGFLPAGFSDC